MENEAPENLDISRLSGVSFGVGYVVIYPTPVFAVYFPILKGGFMGKKRRRSVHLNVMVTPEERELIQQRMDEAGIRNMGAYMRKMALNGYVLNVDLAPVRELVSLQRRCANNLNQVAIHANSYGVYPDEIKQLQRDYAALWEPLSEMIKQIGDIVEK